MLDIKECRKIKRDYTKNNEGKNIIVNVEGFPLCYMIITHGNGKSWGYFFDENWHLFLGTSNQKVINANLQIRDYNAFSDDYELELIGGNDAAKRMYSRLIDSIDNRYRWCRNWRGSNNLIRAFRINPVLLANLVDCNVLRGKGFYNDPFDHLDKLSYYIKDFDYTKPLIKDACKMPPKWLRFLLDYRAQVNYVNLLRKYNYSVDELYKDQYRWYTTEIPEELIPNIKAGLKYASDRLYRDYYNMQRQLSDESKRQFPVLPKDVKKYHDRVLPIYNREQAYRKEKELSEKQKQYATNFYKKAVKYNYSDDTYSIKACEKLVDLLVEGSNLHHCVGSYVNSVSTGKEYILFLRKNSDPDTPYFTVDLTPEKHVRQIHGLCNCNITEEIKPFIQSWVKKFKLSLDGCSGVYCALY